MKDIAFFVTGIVVGVMNAFGGGGMLVGFPILITLGMPSLLANATANIITSPGQLASAYGYRKALAKIPHRYAWLILPIVLGSAAGAITLRHTSAESFAKLVPLLISLGLILFAIQPLLRSRLKRRMKRRNKTTLPLLIIGAALIPISFYGGFFGAGYGFILLAFFGFTNLVDTHMVNGLKNIAATFVSLTAMVCLLGAHLIDWRIGIVTGLGAIVGGYNGSRIAQRISSRWLRTVIMSVGVCAICFLFLIHYQ